MPKLNWAQQLEARLRSSPLLVILFFASVLVSSLLVLGSTVLDARDWYEKRFHWEEQEYRKLTGLRAGFALAKFQEELGSPVFERPVDAGAPRPFSDRPRSRGLLPFARRIKRHGLTESSFRGRGYWVQAVSDEEGIVQVYAVTSCNDNFRPTFVGPYGAFRVTLNRSTLASVRPSGGAGGLVSQYFPSGATANSFFFDMTYGGNPLDYKSFAWGVNDACEGWYDRYRKLWDRGLLPIESATEWGYNGPPNRGGSRIARLRVALVVNTYAETAPATEVDLALSPFHIGVDRILVRTLWGA